MDGTTTYETDEDGYPTPAGILEMLKAVAANMPYGRERGDMYYAIGYVRHSLGLAGEEE